jgi:hypothetical protein
MSSNQNDLPELDSRKLALALIQVVQMWSNRRYQTFLNRTEDGELTDAWFSWFVGAWNVARNIKDGRKSAVREYLGSDFRQAASDDDYGECVDVAARFIQRQGWSSRGCLPVSLVSKVGFFLRPDRFIPLDRFSVKGLNVLHTTGGSRMLKRNSYKAYLSAFDEQYTRLEPQLIAALREPWVITMADQLGCPRAALSSIAMRRKLFDDYLMHSAEYRA